LSGSQKALVAIGYKFVFGADLADVKMFIQEGRRKSQISLGKERRLMEYFVARDDGTRRRVDLSGIANAASFTVPLQHDNENGARGGSRTHNLQLRRLTLYPIELHARSPQNRGNAAFAQLEFTQPI
jgi:hypothetical protein